MELNIFNLPVFAVPATEGRMPERATSGGQLRILGCHRNRGGSSYATRIRRSSTNERERIMEDRTRQLEEFVQEWAAAELRGDATFLEGALTDDFVGVGPLGFMLTKKQWLSRYESGDLAYESLALDELAARFYGSAAVATCRQSQSGTYQGQAVDIMHGEFR